MKRSVAGLVVCAAFAVVPLGVPRAETLPVVTPQGDGPSCTVGEKCVGDCGCRPGCSISCTSGQEAKCEPANQTKGLCYDAKCYCKKVRGK